jgi:hypothetical protein
MTSVSKRLAGFALGAALCFSSSATVAAVASAPAPQAISPFAAIGVFGTQASATALCGSNAAVAAAAGAAAAAAQQPGPGCVLPVVDAPPVVTSAPAPPPAPLPPPPAAGIGLTPILLGLLGVAAIAAIFLLDNDDDDDDDEVLSPT